MARWRLVGFLLAAGCEAGAVDGEVREDASVDAARVKIDAVTVDLPSRPDVVDVPAPQDVVSAPDISVAPDVTVDPGTDDAEMVEARFPTAMGCSANTTAVLRVRNRGTATWTRASGHALGAVDDSDPFFTADTRVRLADGERVAPGAVHEFSIPLRAMGMTGSFTTDWRMVHDGVRWFGDTSTQDVRVECPVVPPPEFRLSEVTIVGSPEVRDFPITSRITSLSFRPGTLHIDHTRRGMWPPVQIDPDGTTQEATVWIFFHIEGRWYGTGGERLRPNQTDKMLENPSVIGPDWFYDRSRWGLMAGYVPAPGERVGFMIVAGSTRADSQTPVRERTGVVVIPFPRDGVETSFPPFAWEE